jgi:hypothetical protein
MVYEILIILSFVIYYSLCLIIFCFYLSYYCVFTYFSNYEILTS